MNIKKIISLTLLACSMSFFSCSAVSRTLNPFYEPPSEIALKGNLNDHALTGGGSRDNSARKALESMATYQRAQAPNPAKPVMNPAVVRLMWIPDHLNRNGDLVPAHYYYLKVKKEDFAVSDAFELQGQLSKGSGASNVPFVYGQ